MDAETTEAVDGACTTGDRQPETSLFFPRRVGAGAAATREADETGTGERQRRRRVVAGVEPIGIGTVILAALKPLPDVHLERGVRPAWQSPYGPRRGR